jgi:hypothetical protein
MRREIMIVRLPEGAASWETDRVPLGPQAVVRSELARVFGDGTWQSPDQGVFDGVGFSLLAKLSIFDTVDTLMLEVWGDGDPASSLKDLCSLAGWQAVDLDTRKLLFTEQES